MKPHLIFIPLALFLSLNLCAQTGEFFSLKEIIHNNINYSTVKPSIVQVDSKGGFLEAEVTYYGNCREKYRFEFQFDQDMSSLQANKPYGFTYTAKLMSSQCNTNRTPYMRPLAPNGGWSGLAASSGYANFVNVMGVLGSDRLYAKALGKYKTGTMRGEFNASHGPLNAHTWLNFVIEGPSNLKGNGFYYEFLFVYQIVGEAPQQTFSCPPPDCSGFPGTVPVWNFDTNKGECLCSDGMHWDKTANKCVPINRKAWR